MKRFVVPFLAFIALAVPYTAHAEWVTKEVKWRISGVGPFATSTTIFVRDTSVTSIGPVDTTSEFSLDDATVPPRGIGMPPGVATTGNGVLASTDTCVVGWLILQSDTTATPTAGLTSVTTLIDGKVGGFGSTATLARGWVKADSSLVNGAAGGGMILGDETVAIPIRSISPYGNVFRYQTFRARITGAGTTLSAARVFLRYFRPDLVEHH